MYLAINFVKSLLHLLSNVFKFMFYINKNTDTSLFQVKCITPSATRCAQVLLLKNKGHVLTLQDCGACPSKNWHGFYFCAHFALRAGGVEAVRGMEEESWKELGSPPLVHILKRTNICH